MHPPSATGIVAIPSPNVEVKLSRIPLVAGAVQRDDKSMITECWIGRQ